MFGCWRLQGLGNWVYHSEETECLVSWWVYSGFGVYIILLRAGFI